MAKNKEKRTKVAIIGGGTGALTAAYNLISQPGGQKKFDITVYQMGWRLGGKGASGRNQKVCNRIEEHGLHVWSGFYSNAFQMMRACYPELNRTPGRDPLATVFADPKFPDATPAFCPENLVVVQEFVNGAWRSWEKETPVNDLLPGDGEELSLWDFLKIAIGWLGSMGEDLVKEGALASHSKPRQLPRWVESILKEIERSGSPKRSKVKPVGKGKQTSKKQTSKGAKFGGLAGELDGEVEFVNRRIEEGAERMEHEMLGSAKFIVDRLNPFPHTHSAGLHGAVVWLVEKFVDWVFESLDKDMLNNDTLRRLAILFDMLSATILGVLRDGVLYHGTTVIDDIDLIQWLKKHGARDFTTSSGLIRGYYDYCFAYENGDPSKPLMAAGDGLLHLSRLVMDVQGAVFFKMQAGMGDTVFTPLYLVLRNMGVKFEFFHKMTDLKLAAGNKDVVDQVQLQVQATVTKNARDDVHELNGKQYSGEYWPLFPVEDLPCWPSEPFYKQLDQGSELEARCIDLESAWADWSGVGPKILKRGKDFDLVVLGVSLEPLKYCTTELIAQNEAWAQMLENMRSTQTVGVQIWNQKDWKGYGCDYGGSLLTAYAQTIQTWGDFSQVLPQETWPANQRPGSVSYLCGNLPQDGPLPDFSDHDFPKREYQRVRDMARQWFTDNTACVWPDAQTELNPTGMDWNQLSDVTGGSGIERFDAQFFRPNIFPSERYVLTVPNDYKYRMKNGKTPFKNLYLAGDFTFTGILCSIESSVMSGMMASRAISGYPQKIHGEVEIPD